MRGVRNRIERNRPYGTFGWGVVVSDATLDLPPRLRMKV